MPISGAWGQFPDIDALEERIARNRKWYIQGLELKMDAKILNRAKLDEYVAILKLRQLLEEQSALPQRQYTIKETPFTEFERWL